MNRYRRLGQYYRGIEGGRNLPTYRVRCTPSLPHGLWLSLTRFIRPDLFSTSSSLLSAPKGVLLYGPPGCGKTMLAKALARESGACFINLHISTLTEKWYGDSNKLVSAVFTLARKLQPTIVFIDEIDAVLRSRFLFSLSNGK